MAQSEMPSQLAVASGSSRDSAFRVQSAPRPLVRWILGATFVVAAICVWVIFGTGAFPWQDPIGIAFLWAYAGCCTAAIAISLMRLLLDSMRTVRAARVFAVARVVIDEAIRRRGALVAVSILFLFVTLLAIQSPHGSPIEHRLRTFITYSIEIGTVLLSLLTIAIACATVSGDVSERHVFTLLVKPIERRQYLAGKWLGVTLTSGALLSALAVTLCGLCFSQRAAITEGLAGAPSERVLVARRSLLPRPDPPFEGRIESEIERLEQSNPQIREDAAAMAVVRDNIPKNWRSVSPGESERFEFTGIRPEVAVAGVLTLHLRPQLMIDPRHPAGDTELRMELSLNGHRIDRHVLEEDVYLDVGRFVASGRLLVEIHNPGKSGEEPSMFFWGNESLELFHNTGSFAMNLVRTMLILWFKLWFLGWLGVSLGSQIGFPVACLTAVILGGIAGSAQFILADDHDGHGHGHGSVHAAADSQAFGQRALEQVAATFEEFGRTVARVLQRFGSYQPGTELASGRIVEWDRVASCALWIGLLWSCFAAIPAMLLFRRRELARIQV